MRLSRLTLGAASLVFTSLLAHAPSAEPVAANASYTSTLAANVTLFDVKTGDPRASAVAGEPFGIRVTLSDPATGKPISDEHLAGWVRPVSRSDSRCREAARAYFVSLGELPRGATDLSRSLYGVRHDDGTLTIVDWERSIASANILAAVRAPDATGPLIARRNEQAFYFATSGGSVATLPAAERTAVHVTALAATSPAPILSTNGWIAVGTELHPPTATVPVTLPQAPMALVPTLTDEDGIDRAVLVRLPEGVMLVEETGATGPVVTVPGLTGADYAAPADAFLIVDGSDNLTIVYGAQRRVSVPLPTPARDIAVHPDGLFAIAWSPESAAFSIVEVATGATVQAVALNRPPIDQTIREVAFAGRSAFILLQDIDFVLVVDLSRARRGEAAAIRPVRIGPKVGALPQDAGPFLVESLRGHESGAVIVLHPDLSTAFPVMEESGNTTAAMNGFRIRGGRPIALAELVGGLEEVSPGLYEAATVLPHGGPHEVIVSGGVGRFTACATFAIEGEEEERLTFRLLATPQKEGGALHIALRIVDEDGVAQRAGEGYPILVQSLTNGWRSRVAARRVGPDSYLAVVDRAPYGPTSVTFDAPLPARLNILPATIEVSP